MDGTLELLNRKVGAFVPVPAGTRYGVLFEHLKILERQKGNAFGDVKARRRELLDGLGFRKARREIDIYHPAAQPQKPAELGVELGAMRDAVERVIKDNYIHPLHWRGRIVEVDDLSHAIRDTRRKERIGLQHRDRIGSFQLERANQLRGVVLRERRERGPKDSSAQDKAKPCQQCVSCRSRNR